MLNLCLIFNESHPWYAYKIMYIKNIFCNCGIQYSGWARGQNISERWNTWSDQLKSVIGHWCDHLSHDSPISSFYFFFPVKGWNIIVTQTSCVSFHALEIWNYNYTQQLSVYMKLIEEMRLYLEYSKNLIADIIFHSTSKVIRYRLTTTFLKM